MTAEGEIRHAIARYAQVVDDGDLEGILACFTPDARFVSRFGEEAGLDAIRTLFDRLIRGRAPGVKTSHLFVNPVISVDGRHAEVSTDLVMLRCENEGPWRIQLVGRHLDRMEQRNGEWLFAHKRIELSGFSQTSFKAP
jgi:ketosteroid isomerase-like protein